MLAKLIIWESLYLLFFPLELEIRLTIKRESLTNITTTMRNPKRIPILLDIYSRESVKESYLKNVIGLAQKSDVNKYLTKWTQKEEAGIIEQVWQETPN